MAAEFRIDLYSDTHTKPSQAMREAMAQAVVGDEQQEADPTTNRLQELVAELLGKERALFLPSGTMCNAIAYRVWCDPGDEVMCDKTAHTNSSVNRRTFCPIWRHDATHCRRSGNFHCRASA